MRAGHLTRKGKVGNYEYIQKYPYAVYAEQAAAVKRSHAAKK
jgi:hypothetical protein